MDLDLCDSDISASCDVETGTLYTKKGCVGGGPDVL
jgi:hypothetical protein